MERDFLIRLSTTSADAINSPSVDIEQKESRMQWSFSDRVSTSSQVVSLKSFCEDKSKRDIFHQAPSPGYVTASATGNSNQQSDVQPVYHNQGVKLYPVQSSQNQDIPSRIPTKSCFPTYHDTRIINKPSDGSDQLTIFYAGSVAVYDSVSPEKARAIMLLAGNGTSSTSANPVPSNQVHVPFTKPSKHDVRSIGNPPRSTLTTSGLVSPFSHAKSQRGDVTNLIAITSSQQQLNPPKPANSQRSSAGYVISGHVPQARKASLARFLEKRKERVASAKRYSVDHKSSNAIRPLLLTT